MNTMKSIISASLLLKLSSAACKHATISSDGRKVALDVCEIASGLSNPGIARKYTCNSNNDGIEVTEYSDELCSTESTAITAVSVDDYTCDEITECEYIHYYSWTTSSENLCWTPATAITFITFASNFEFSGITGATIGECGDFDGDGNWETITANSCDAGYSGFMFSKADHSDDGGQCGSATGGGSNLYYAMANDGSEEKDNDDTCRIIAGCSSGQMAPSSAPTDAPTESPTDAPTESPTDAPTESPTDAPTDAPTTEPTAEPSVEPTEAPTDEEQPACFPNCDEPTTSPTTSPTESPTAAPIEPTESPTGAPSDSPTAAPTGSPTAPTTASPTESPTTASPTASPVADTDSSTSAPSPSNVNVSASNGQAYILAVVFAFISVIIA